MKELERLKLATLQILKNEGNLQNTKDFISENEISLPKDVFLLFLNRKFFLINRKRSLLTIIKSDNRNMLERTSQYVDVPSKRVKTEYLYGIPIEVETIHLNSISNW